jgi:hypothetical protein
VTWLEAIDVRDEILGDSAVIIEEKLDRLLDVILFEEIEFNEVETVDVWNKLVEAVDTNSDNIGTLVIVLVDEITVLIEFVG